MDNMPEKVIDIDKNLPIWESVMIACINCAYHWFTAIRHFEHSQFYECPKCNHIKGLVTWMNNLGKERIGDETQN